MNVAFYLLLAIALVWIWFSMCYLFPSIGDFFQNMYYDVKHVMTDDTEEIDDD